MESRRIAILAAVPEEVAVLLRRLEGRRDLNLGGEGSAGNGAPGPTAALGRVAGVPVAILATGDGARNARHGVAALFRAIPVSRVLVIGVAGGLSPELGVGDLIVAREVVAEAGSTWRSRSDFVSAAIGAGARVGTVVTARRLAATVAEKGRLWEHTGLGIEACVVDLESAHFVAAAEAAGVPWLVARVVSDAANEDLPRGIVESSGPDGTVQRRALLLHAARRPWTIPELLRMRSRAGRCARSLARVAESWLSDRAGSGELAEAAESRVVAREAAV